MCSYVSRLLIFAFLVVVAEILKDMLSVKIAFKNIFIMMVLLFVLCFVLYSYSCKNVFGVKKVWPSKVELYLEVNE